MITKFNSIALTSLMLISPMLAAPSAPNAKDAASIGNEIQKTGVLTLCKENKGKIALGTGVVLLIWLLWKKHTNSVEQARLERERRAQEQELLNQAQVQLNAVRRAQEQKLRDQAQAEAVRKAQEQAQTTEIATRRNSPLANPGVRMALTSSFNAFTTNPATALNIEPIFTSSGRSMLKNATFARLYQNFGKADASQKVELAGQILTYLKSFKN